MADPDGPVSASGTNYIDGLLWGVKWQTSANNTVTYNLWNDFQTWNATETAAVQGALQAWANVADINFAVQNDTGADLWAYKLSDADMTSLFGSGILGLFTPPDSTTFPGAWGIGAFNSGLLWSSAGLQPGGYTYSTLLHEFGHGLGLAHPHDNGAGSTPTYGDLGIGSLDDGLFTVMSYNDIGTTWNPYPNAGWDTYGQAATPMPADIAAIQHIYGANTSYNTGDTTYSLLTNRYEAIWDAGGADTITAAGLTGSVTINLNEGLYLSSQSGSYGGYMIAYGADIENATGGTGNDTLTGNALDNRLDGGAGADTMSGGAGNDTYVVDSASDQVIEGSGDGTDTVESSVTFTLGGNVENLTLTGGGSILATGNALANVLTGNSGDNTLDGGSGNDTLDGGGGDDTYVVDSASDQVIEGSGAGADSVQSSVTFTLGNNVENLTLTGGANITATGNALANVLTGNSGDNTLDGGGGNDTMQGGGGNDTYVVVIGRGPGDRGKRGRYRYCPKLGVVHPRQQRREPDPYRHRQHIGIGQRACQRAHRQLGRQHPRRRRGGRYS